MTKCQKDLVRKNNIRGAINACNESADGDQYNYARYLETTKFGEGVIHNTSTRIMNKKPIKIIYGNPMMPSDKQEQHVPNRECLGVQINNITKITPRAQKPVFEGGGD